MMEEVKVGDHVEVTTKDLKVKGEVAFIGLTEFAAGKWIGLLFWGLSNYFIVVLH